MEVYEYKVDGSYKAIDSHLLDGLLEESNGTTTCYENQGWVEFIPTMRSPLGYFSVYRNQSSKLPVKYMVSVTACGDKVLLLMDGYPEISEYLARHYPVIELYDRSAAWRDAVVAQDSAGQPSPDGDE